MSGNWMCHNGINNIVSWGADKMLRSPMWKEGGKRKNFLSKLQNLPTNFIYFVWPAVRDHYSTSWWVTIVMTSWFGFRVCLRIYYHTTSPEAAWQCRVTVAHHPSLHGVGEPRVCRWNDSDRGIARGSTVQGNRIGRTEGGCWIWVLNVQSSV